MEVDLSIAQMQRGMDVEGFYLLKAAFSKVTASGKPFLSAVLADTSGTIEAKVWDYSGPVGAGSGDTGRVVKIRGQVSEFKGAPQLTEAASAWRMAMTSMTCRPSCRSLRSTRTSVCRRSAA